jgi:N-acetylglucosaminyl-diphospho-decaprenol L-rhamnosyltransferase
MRQAVAGNPKLNTTPEKQPLTSIVMVSYYTGPALVASVAAVLAQTAPVQLCLVDNGNPPEALAELRALAARDGRLRMLSGHGNIGFSRGCNLGARASEGEYLLFLNPDSLLPPDALEVMHRHAQGLRRPYMLGARLLDEDGREGRGCRRALLTPTTALVEALRLGALFPRARLDFNGTAVEGGMAPMPAISGAFMFLPRADFEAIGGFDEGYFLHVEDLDLCLRFRRAGGEIYFVPEVVVTHLGGTSRATPAFIERQKARGFSRYFHKNFAGTRARPLLLALDAAIWTRAWLKIGLLQLSGFRK